MLETQKKKKKKKKEEKPPLFIYLDAIILDAGPGLTVQHALQHPEFLSMVIQLLLLCHMYECDSLVQVIVEAIDRNVRKLSGDTKEGVR